MNQEEILLCDMYLNLSDKYLLDNDGWFYAKQDEDCIDCIFANILFNDMYSMDKNTNIHWTDYWTGF